MQVESDVAGEATPEKSTWPGLCQLRSSWIISAANLSSSERQLSALSELVELEGWG